MNNKIITRELIKKVAEDEKKQNKRIAVTSGCFDIIHAGHVQYLEEAKTKGDILIVLLNSDYSVKGLKGNLRPIVPQEERAVVIAGLGCVDYVCIFDESTPCNMLELIKPDVFVKGGDYSSKQIPEEDVMIKYGGKVEYVSLIENCSSTNIINKIMSIKEY